jgi:hypothetical protein
MRADLFSKDAILLDKVFDNGLLMLAHPASDRHDQKRERIQTARITGTYHGVRGIRGRSIFWTIRR